MYIHFRGGEPRIENKHMKRCSTSLPEKYKIKNKEIIFHTHHIDNNLKISFQVEQK